MSELATDPQHSPTCSGCPACRAEFARVWGMSKAEYAAYLAGDTSSVPKPPSLIDAVRERSRPKPPSPVSHPVRPGPPAPPARKGPPEPPSLIDAVRERNKP